MSQSAAEKVLHIPLSVFESAETKDELEDWLLVHDPLFIHEMERIHKEESGKGIPLKEAAKKWAIDS